MQGSHYGVQIENYSAMTIDALAILTVQIAAILVTYGPRHCLLGGVNTNHQDIKSGLASRFHNHMREFPGALVRLITLEIPQDLLCLAAAHLLSISPMCCNLSCESLFAALMFSNGVQLNTFSNCNRWGANCMGSAKLYLMIFDTPGHARGCKDNSHNLRRDKLTAFDLGFSKYNLDTSKYALGTSKFNLGTSKHALGTSKMSPRSAATLANDRAILDILNATVNFRALNFGQRQQAMKQHLNFIGIPSAACRASEFMKRLSKRPHLYADLLQ